MLIIFSENLPKKFGTNVSDGVYACMHEKNGPWELTLVFFSNGCKTEHSSVHPRGKSVPADIRECFTHALEQNVDTILICCTDSKVRDVCETIQKNIDTKVLEECPIAQETNAMFPIEI